MQILRFALCLTIYKFIDWNALYPSLNPQQQIFAARLLLFRPKCVQHAKQLFTGNRLYKVLGRLHTKSFQRMFPGCGEENNPAAVSHRAQLACSLNPQLLWHINVHKDNIRRVFLLPDTPEQVVSTQKPLEHKRCLRMAILICSQHLLCFVQICFIIIAECY